MGTIADLTDIPPFFRLPIELRFAIYRHCSCICSPNGKVEVVSNYLDGQPPTKIKFYTTVDLTITEVSRIVRSEASEIFYSVNVFILNSYPRTQEYGQQRLYGMKHYQVDYSRVRKAHVLSPRGFFPVSLDSCIRGAHRMRAFLDGIADALTKSHCMRHLLIESYEFERTVFDRASQAMPCDIRYYLEPLEKVRRIQNCYVRSMKISLWPYLRLLEQATMRGCNDLALSSQCGHDIVEKAQICGKILENLDIVDAFGDPEHPEKNKIFETFNTEPLYKNIDFLTLFADDIL